jgi:inner membrane protease subunit 1
MSFLEYLRQGLKYGLSISACVVIMNEFILEVSQTIGDSMLPTLHSRDVVVIKKFNNSYSLGDVVIGLSPMDPDICMCKRIVGMPHDYICIDPSASDKKFIRVPGGHVYLGGDNLSASTDSRVYGPVPLELIQGKLLARIWPSFGIIRNGFEETENLLKNHFG